MDTLLLEVTSLCPFDCRHCSRDRTGQPAHLSWPLFERLLLEAKDLGLSDISLTGGEPLAWPECIRAIEMALLHDFRVGMVTNGWLFAERFEPFVRRNPASARRLSLSFSLDGPDAETHDHFRRMPGSFERIRKAMISCRELRIPFTVKSSLWRGNLNRLLDLIVLPRSLGGDLSFIFLTPTPDLVEQDLIPSPKEYEVVFDHITRQLMPMFPGIAIEGVCSMDQPIPLCNPFASLPSIDYHGNATVCCNLSNLGEAHGKQEKGPEWLGSLVEKRLPEIIENHLGRLPDLAATLVQRSDRFWSRGCVACLRRFGKLAWLGRTLSPWREVT